MKAVFALLVCAIVVVCATQEKLQLPKLGKLPSHHPREAAKYLQQQGEKLRHLELKRAPHHGPRLQTACEDAFINFLVVFGNETCQAQLALAFNFDDHSRTQEEFETDIIQYCTGCAEDFSSALNGLVASCTAGEISEEDEENIRTFLSAINLPCAQDGDDYCADDFYAIGLVDDGSDEVTPEELATICAPCVKVMFNAMMQFSTSEDGLFISLWINLICQKDLKGTTDTADDEFCWPIAQEQFAYVDPDEDELTTEEIDNICRPCVRQIIVAITNIYVTYPELADDDFDPTTVVTLDGLCIRDTDNRICLKLFLIDVQEPPIQVGAHCPSFETDPVPTTCEQECADSIWEMVADMGCCAAQLPGYLALAAADDDNNPLMANFYDDTCLGGPNYDTCGIASVEGSLIISDFIFAWYNSHKEDSDALIIADITLTSGADDGSVTLGEVTETADGGVMVSFTIGVKSNAQADATASAAMQSLSFPNLNQQTPLTEARTSYVASFAASSATVTPSYATYESGTGGAGSVAAGAAAVLCPAAAVVFGL